MELLIGEYRNTLDEKGRILFPTKLRKILNVDVLVMTKAPEPDKCVLLFTVDEWKSLSDKILNSTSLFDPLGRRTRRAFLGAGHEVAFDNMGRLSIPQSLREYGSLSKDCIIMGVNRYVELWDADVYKAYLGETESIAVAAMEKLSSISF